MDFKYVQKHKTRFLSYATTEKLLDADNYEIFDLNKTIVTVQNELFPNNYGDEKFEESLKYFLIIHNYVISSKLKQTLNELKYYFEIGINCNNVSDARKFMKSLPLIIKRELG